jgi:isopentenyl diphosphate isomerase/L-lactate dehydrogenase-like FMN-dependent dehydrogenase
MMANEMRAAMALTGCTSVAQIDASVLADRG